MLGYTGLSACTRYFKSSRTFLLLPCVRLTLFTAVWGNYSISFGFHKKVRKAFCCTASKCNIASAKRIIESFQLEGNIKGHLVQLPCNEHIQLSQVAQSPIQPKNRHILLSNSQY